MTACAIIKDTAATGNTCRFADTAVFPASIWTAAIRSDTEAEREGETSRQGEREGAGGGSETESNGDVKSSSQGHAEWHGVGWPKGC